MLQNELASTDVLRTSFGASAFDELGLHWTLVHTRYPGRGHVAIVGGLLCVSVSYLAALPLAWPAAD